MARYDEEGRRIKTPVHAVGEDLADLSVEELRDRVAVLKQEINRIEEAIKGKSGSIAAAEAIFRK